MAGDVDLLGRIFRRAVGDRLDVVVDDALGVGEPLLAGLAGARPERSDVGIVAERAFERGQVESPGRTRGLGAAARRATARVPGRRAAGRGGGAPVELVGHGVLFRRAARRRGAGRGLSEGAFGHEPATARSHNRDQRTHP